MLRIFWGEAMLTFQQGSCITNRYLSNYQTIILVRCKPPWKIKDQQNNNVMKNKKSEWESLCWLVAGCTPESADQFRVDTKLASRRRTLSCRTFLRKQFYLQFLITPFSFNWHVRILNINSFEDQFLKQTENIDYCAKRQTDISIHCGKTFLAVVFWWMPLVFMKFNPVSKWSPNLQTLLS